MNDDEILALLGKHPGLMLGLYPPRQMVQRGDTIKFERPPGLTPFGEYLFAFARDLVAAERTRCAGIVKACADAPDYAHNNERILEALRAVQAA